MALITEEIAAEIGGEVGEKILAHEEIQIYADHDHFRYLWVDRRAPETSDVWRKENNYFQTRQEVREALIQHLK